jgi:hypothetical protein
MKIAVLFASCAFSLGSLGQHEEHTEIVSSPEELFLNEVIVLNHVSNLENRTYLADFIDSTSTITNYFEYVPIKNSEDQVEFKLCEILKKECKFSNNVVQVQVIQKTQINEKYQLVRIFESISVGGIIQYQEFQKTSEDYSNILFRPNLCALAVSIENKQISYVLPADSHVSIYTMEGKIVSSFSATAGRNVYLLENSSLGNYILYAVNKEGTIVCNACFIF